MATVVSGALIGENRNLSGRTDSGRIACDPYDTAATADDEAEIRTIILHTAAESDINVGKRTARFRRLRTRGVVRQAKIWLFVFFL